MLGGDLTRADAWTESLLTNREVLDVDQHSTGTRVVLSNPETMVIVAQAEGKTDRHYVAVFNRSETRQVFDFSWDDLKIPPHTYSLRDLWQNYSLGQADGLFVALGPHASGLFAVTAEADTKP